MCANKIALCDTVVGKISNATRPTGIEHTELGKDKFTESILFHHNQLIRGILRALYESAIHLLINLGCNFSFMYVNERSCLGHDLDNRSYL